ncbi:hypothetical protein PQX77_002341 [Marasmius sp. AFHP31]|nr:hypothetical protein PQX77_002341 [Marasmius sp. AFHP31]
MNTGHLSAAPQSDSEDASNKATSLDPDSEIDTPRAASGSKDGLVRGHAGPSGKYVFSPPELAVLQMKIPTNKAAPTGKRTQVAAQIYDLLIKYPLFEKPHAETAEQWKSAFGEAHAALVEWTMADENDSDYEHVLTHLWDDLSPDEHQHWDAIAVEQSPILQNQEGFMDGFRAIAQSCLQFKLLGRRGVAIIFCFNKEKVIDSTPVTETRIINKRSDSSMNMEDSRVMEEGETLMICSTSALGRA